MWITTSGVNWTDEVMFTRTVMGADRVMYAMDYPYQHEPDEVSSMDALPISDDEKHRFFEGIAKEVFGLDLE